MESSQLREREATDRLGFVQPAQVLILRQCDLGLPRHVDEGLGLRVVDGLDIGINACDEENIFIRVGELALYLGRHGAPLEVAAEKGFLYTYQIRAAVSTLESAWGSLLSSLSIFMDGRPWLCESDTHDRRDV